MSIEKRLDWLQRLQAAWDAVPAPIRRVIVTGLSIMGTAIVTTVSQWQLVHIWFASLATGVVVAYLHAGYQLATAYAYRVRQGPPPPPPEQPSISIRCVSGDTAFLEVTNSGAVGDFVIRGRIVKASDGYEIPYMSVFRIASSTRIRKGETKVFTIASRGANHLWVPNAGGHVAEFLLRSDLCVHLLIAVEHDLAEALPTLRKVVIDLYASPLKSHIAVGLEREAHRDEE